MSAKDAKSVKHKTGADLRAQAEARLSAQAGPAAEASRRADVIRAGLTNYAATMDKITEAYQRQDWKALGYESFNAYAGGEFGEARVKLTPEHRAQILPAFLAVGMSKRGAAAALGVDEKTIRNDLRGADNSAPKKKSPLVEAMTQAIEEAQAAADEPNTSADDGDQPGPSMPPAPSASGPSASPSVDGPDVTPETAAGGLNVAPPVDGADEARQSLDVPAGDGPNAIRPVPGNPEDSSPEASEASPQGEAPAGGDRNGHRAGADPAAVATPVEPGIDHPDALGAAPGDASSRAGLPDGFDMGRDGDREVEGETGLSSSTDPAAIVGDFQAFVRRVDDTYDPDVAGPLCTEEQMTALHTAVDDLAQFVGLLERWRNK